MTVIAISGKLGSGKTTLAELIKKYNSSFIEKSFAFKLKQIVSIITSCDINQTLTQEGKNTFIPTFNMTIGEMLQKIGTNVMRDYFDKDIWIKSLLLELEQNDGNYIISDCRFKNEAQAVKDIGGIVIRINRTNNDTALNSKRDLNHPSEIDLDDYTGFDFIIENDGTLEDLDIKIKNILKKINI